MLIKLNQGRFPGFAKQRLTEAAAALMAADRAQDCSFHEEGDGSEVFLVRSTGAKVLYAVHRADGRYRLTNDREEVLAEGPVDVVARLMD
jgi:hypothetical protein